MKTRTRINQNDQEVLDELITCVRKIVAAHTRELDERETLHREGKKVPDKWNISPATIRGVLSLVPKLLEIRRVLYDLPPLKRESVKAAKPAPVAAAPKQTGPQPVDFMNINNAISRAAQLGIK